MKTENNIITILETRIAEELKPIDRESRFDEMLDECYSFEKVGGIFARMSPSSVLKECDPVAYRCGVNDYADSEEWLEIGGENYDADECEEIKTALLDELESDLSDAEEELSEAEDDEDAGSTPEEIATLRANVAEIESRIAELNKHSW